MTTGQSGSACGSALWDDCPVDEQEREMDEYLGEPTNQVFLAERPEGGLCGFLEAAIHPWAVGCDQCPVGYIEGWYVDADVRKAGLGRALVEAAEAWTRSKGCLQIASDALTDNLDQPASPSAARLRGDVSPGFLQEGTELNRRRSPGSAALLRAEPAAEDLENVLFLLGR